MADPRPHEPVLLVIAAFSRHLEALSWGARKLEDVHGPVSLWSPVYDFVQTRYYEPTMGAGLRKQFLAFGLIPPEALPSVKLHTNSLETELARAGEHAERRPLNLDPGVLSLSRFVLASAKNHAHRISLGQGIYAEVTLRFQGGTFRAWPWTFADYRQPLVLEFLNSARQHYRRLLSAEYGPETSDSS